MSVCVMCERAIENCEYFKRLNTSPSRQFVGPYPIVWMQMLKRKRFKNICFSRSLQNASHPIEIRFSSFRFVVVLFFQLWICVKKNWFRLTLTQFNCYTYTRVMRGRSCSVCLTFRSKTSQLIKVFSFSLSFCFCFLHFQKRYTNRINHGEGLL